MFESAAARTHDERRKALRHGLTQRLLVAAAALSVVLAAAPHALAGNKALSRFAGEYVYAGTEQEGQAIVDKGIDDALAELNPVVKMMIKQAIEARPNHQFIRVIRIETPEGRIGLQFGELEKVTLKVNESETRSRDGQSGKVTHKWDGSRISSLAESEMGGVENVLSLLEGGKKLQRDVTWTASRLPKPIHYRLLYARK